MKDRKKILLIEDSPEDAYRMIREFRKSHDLKVCVSYDEFCEVDLSLFDVIVSDWFLGQGLTAQNIIDHVQKNEIEMPVVIISGVTTPTEIIDLNTQEINAFFTKQKIWLIPECIHLILERHADFLKTKKNLFDDLQRSIRGIEKNKKL